MRANPFILLFAAGLCLLGGALRAQEVDTIVQARAELRSAQSSLFGGKTATAERQIAYAEELIGKIRAAKPTAPELPDLEAALKKAKKDLAARTRGVSSQQELSAAQKSSPLKGTLSKSRGISLPPAAYNVLLKIDARLERVEPLLSAHAPSTPEYAEDIRQARGLILSCREMLEQLKYDYRTQLPPAHPDVTDRADRIEIANRLLLEKEKERGEQLAEARRREAEELGRKWMIKLRGYITGPGQRGFDPNRSLALDRSTEKLEKRKALLEEAGRVAARLRRTDFYGTKTPELAQAEQTFYTLLTKLEKSCSAPQGAQAQPRTVPMQPDRFAGKEKEIALIKTNAREVLMNVYPDVKIYATNIVSQEWEENNDGRSLSVQIAGRRAGEEKALLFTVLLSQEKNPGQGWSRYSGTLAPDTPPVDESTFSR